jgi:two-component system, NtrC family, nitrogen regulation sensor histidine kinase GlnL
MRKHSVIRLEWFLKAGSVLLVALLLMLTANSLQLLSRTRAYLEGELEARLMDLKDLLTPELDAKVSRSSGGHSESLKTIALRESVDRIRLFDLDGKVEADSSGLTLGSAKPVLGISAAQVGDVWAGLTVVSPVYNGGGGLVRSLYFPLRDARGRLVVMCELTLGAQHIEDLTELGTTHFVIKALVVTLLILGLLYMLRTLLASQKRIVQAARGVDTGIERDTAGDDVTFVIQSFQTVVNELKIKERELRELKDKAEEKARLIESYNEIVLKSVQSGVVTFDADGTVKTLNPAATEVLGLGRDEVEGKTVNAVFAGGPWLCEIVEDALKEARIIRRGEGGYMRSDGSKRWLGAGTSPMISDDGSLMGAILVFTDLSEVKQLRDKMELKERMTLLGEMSTGIAHELRNPMAVITGYASLLAKRLGTDPEALEAVESMQEEIRGMDDIIREFMNFARPAEMNLSEIDIGPVIDDAVKSMGNIPGGQRIRLDIEPALPKVFGDQVLLRQVFINLINNGLESMEDADGDVYIKARAAGPAEAGIEQVTGGVFVRVDFADEGCGIQDEELKKIFTPFYTTKSKGTGLGLALVQKIVVNHGGRVSVRSDDGKGATFSVILPAGRTGVAHE